MGDDANSRISFDPLQSQYYANGEQIEEDSEYYNSCKPKTEGGGHDFSDLTAEDGLKEEGTRFYFEFVFRK
jgi:hypothetical protein